MSDEHDPALEVSETERKRYDMPQRHRLVFVADKPVRYERKWGEWKEPER